MICVLLAERQQLIDTYPPLVNIDLVVPIIDFGAIDGTATGCHPVQLQNTAGVSVPQLPLYGSHLRDQIRTEPHPLFNSPSFQPADHPTKTQA